MPWTRYVGLCVLFLTFQMLTWWCVQVRFLAVTNAKAMADTEALEIRIKVDKEARQIIIE
jgi:hypothetical protein